MADFPITSLLGLRSEESPDERRIALCLTRQGFPSTVVRLLFGSVFLSDFGFVQVADLVVQVLS